VTVLSIDLFSYKLGKSSLRSKLERVREALRGAPEKIQDLSSIVVDVDPESEEWREAVEEIADAAVNEWLRRDVVEGPPPDAYALLVEAVAMSNRLVIEDSEVEKLAGEVESNRQEEEGGRRVLGF
jgi:hypothetical protein